MPTIEYDFEDFNCPECEKPFVKKTGDGDFYCCACMTIIKDNAKEVDKYFREEYNMLLEEDE